MNRNHLSIRNSAYLWLLVNIGLVFGLVLILTTQPVRAHAPDLVRANPEPEATIASNPETVELWFSEELNTEGSVIQVFDAQGTQVDLGDGGVNLDDPYHASMTVSLPPGLPTGTYRVYYRLILLDKDPSHNQYTFVVDEASDFVYMPDLEPLYVEEPTGSGQWLWIGVIAAMIVVVGVVVFSLKRTSANI